jgi:hypothetical protein
MTPAQFTAQLDELRKRGRPLFFVGCVAVLLTDLDIVQYVLHRYPLQGHRPEAVTAYWVAFAACWPAVVVLYLALRWTIHRYAPVCRTCGAKATWRVRSQILVTGHCPRCDSAFFLPGDPRSASPRGLKSYGEQAAAELSEPKHLAS